jgi:hypothetical protein
MTLKMEKSLQFSTIFRTKLDLILKILINLSKGKKRLQAGALLTQLTQMMITSFVSLQKQKLHKKFWIVKMIFLNQDQLYLTKTNKRTNQTQSILSNEYIKN